MRVAMVVGAFPKFSETFVLNQVTGLIDRGVDVDVFAWDSGDKAEPVHPDVTRYDLLARTRYASPVPARRVDRILKGLRLIVADGYGARKIARLLQLGTSCRGVSPLAPLIAGTAFPETSRYDILLCHFGNNGLMVSLLRAAGVVAGRLVTVFHGFDMTEQLRSTGTHAYARLFREGDLFLPISAHWKRKLIDLGADPARTVVHHMGVDCDRIQFVVRKPCPEEPVRVLSVARFVEKKGLEYGIRAVGRLVRETGPRIHYSIVGEGPLRSELQQVILEEGIESVVELVGPQDQDGILRRLALADIMLAPSVTAEGGDQEGIPVVLMEALAAGIPVVSSCHSGIPELVQDGVSGLLVPERDVEALGKALGTLIRHPERWPVMGRAGRDHVERHFEIGRLNDSLVERLRTLADG